MAKPIKEQIISKLAYIASKKLNLSMLRTYTYKYLNEKMLDDPKIAAHFFEIYKDFLKEDMLKVLKKDKRISLSKRKGGK